MKTLIILLASLTMSPAAFALDGQQFARAHEVWTEIKQTSARAFYADLYLKEGNISQVCFVLGAMVSEVDAAGGNLEVLRLAPVSKGISDSILADIRKTQVAVTDLQSLAVSTVGGCGGGGYRWSTKEVLSKQQLSERLQKISSTAQAMADAFESVVYSH